MGQNQTKPQLIPIAVAANCPGVNTLTVAISRLPTRCCRMWRWEETVPTGSPEPEQAGSRRPFPPSLPSMLAAYTLSPSLALNPSFHLSSHHHFAPHVNSPLVHSSILALPWPDTDTPSLHSKCDFTSQSQTLTPAGSLSASSNGLLFSLIFQSLPPSPT